MKMFYYDCDFGASLIKAEDITSARKKIRSEIGTYPQINWIREATKEDIDWVKGMGGRIPT